MKSGRRDWRPLFSPQRAAPLPGPVAVLFLVFRFPGNPANQEADPEDESDRNDMQQPPVDAKELPFLGEVHRASPLLAGDAGLRHSAKIEDFAQFFFLHESLLDCHLDQGLPGAQ